MSLVAPSASQMHPTEQLDEQLPQSSTGRFDTRKAVVAELTAVPLLIIDDLGRLRVCFPTPCRSERHHDARSEGDQNPLLTTDRWK
jgi:hypothetical protein